MLRILSDTLSVSGFGERAKQIAAAELESVCDEVWTDRIGDVIGLKRARTAEGTTPLRVMIAAHADEIGLMVKHIDKEGFVRLMPIGGLIPRRWSRRG